jgi:hypothetical protein
LPSGQETNRTVPPSKDQESLQSKTEKTREPELAAVGALSDHLKSGHT